MRHHEAENQNSLRAYPFTDDSVFQDARAGRDAMPLGLIVSIRSTAAVSAEAALSGTRLIRVVVSQRFSSVVLETGEAMRLEGVPEPGTPYPLTKLSAFGAEQVCGHVVFGPSVDEGDWAPVSAKLLPANYVYVPASGFTLFVSGDITARYVDDARILLRAPTRSGVELPAGYGIPAAGEDLYLKTPAIVLEAANAPQPACSAESPADCKGAILTVNGVPVPEDGNVEIDSIDPSGEYGDSVPGDSIPGPIDFSAYPAPGDSLPVDPQEPPTVLVDMPTTVAANCGAALGDPNQARLPLAVRAYAVGSDLVVQAAFVNDSNFRAIPCFGLRIAMQSTPSRPIGDNETVFPPVTWGIKTAPPRGLAIPAAVGGWASGAIFDALNRVQAVQGLVNYPARDGIAQQAPPGVAVGSGISDQWLFSPVGWEHVEGGFGGRTPWSRMPARLLSVAAGDVSKPFFEAMDPLEIVCFSYAAESTGMVVGEVISVTASAAAHLVDDRTETNEYGQVVGRSSSSVMINVVIGEAAAFSRDASPDDIAHDLLPEYQA